MLSRGTLGVLLLVLLGFSSLAFAWERRPSTNDPPLSNWSPPATYTPPASASRIRALGDIASPMPFIPVTPCRQYDIRPGTLADNTNLTIALSGAPCGIPSSAAAVSVNITVFGISGAGGNGVFRVGIAANPPTAWINYPPTETQRANAGAVATDGSGNIVVKVNQGGGSIQLTVDVNGYYASTAANQANTFTVVNSGGTTVPAILGQTNSASLNATGVKGVASSPTGATNGVWGDSLSTSDGATGVFGFAEGTSGITTGAWGRTRSSSNGARGVLGEAQATTGLTYGVLGLDSSVTDLSSVGSAGVRGVAGIVNLEGNDLGAAGVRGEGTFYGVGGITNTGIGVIGWSIAGGFIVADGRLGYSSGTNYGVYADTGTIGCNGCVKQFVDPHPTDPSRTIHYVSLEGPEAGTYFRGTARTVQGHAVIEVPDHFRWVTQDEGMTVQLTPVGDLAMMAVVSQDLNRIVVRSSKDVSFHYLVQGIRPAHRDFQPVVEGGEYAPESATGRMKEGWTAWAKQRLIRNGTYNADGTVNMETAERMGWTKMWAERDEQARAAAAKFAAERKRE